MPASLNNLVDRVTARLATETLRELPDDALLRQFLQAGDQAAFTTLVERHAGLVLSVCRRTLGAGPDAEDAFQATFLVLARRARAIRWERCIRGWLYRVAVQVARRARQRAARQRRIEQAAVRNEASPVGNEVTWSEGLACIDREIDALPVNYRAVLLACCLEGKSREEASKELGLSPGQVKGLLERARDLLRARLAHRGIVLPATLLTVVLQQGPAQAASTVLVTTACQASLAFAAGNGQTIAPAVLTAAETTLSAMTLAKSLWATVLGILLTCLAGSGLWLSQHDAVPLATALTALQQASLPEPERFTEAPQPRPAGPEKQERQPDGEQRPTRDGQEVKKLAPVRGRVKSIDQEGGTVVLLVRRGTIDEERTLRVATEAKITLRGVPGTLAELQPGESITGRLITESGLLVELTVHPPEGKK